MQFTRKGKRSLPERVQIMPFRGTKSRNKVSVGEPAEGSFRTHSIVVDVGCERSKCSHLHSLRTLCKRVEVFNSFNKLLVDRNIETQD